MAGGGEPPTILIATPGEGPCEDEFLAEESRDEGRRENLLITAQHLDPVGPEGGPTWTSQVIANMLFFNSVRLWRAS